MFGLSIAKLKKLYNDTKAESNVLVAIVTVVVATILIIVAALIVANVASSLPSVTGTANTTIASTLTASYNALNLMTIVLIVLAAFSKFAFGKTKAAIIAAVIGGLMFMRSRGE